MEATFIPPARLMRALAGVAGAGLVVFLLGMLLAPERAWSGYLMGFCFFTFLALAGPLFLAITHLADVRWAMPLRGIPAAMGATLPGALALGVMLVAGTHALYEWSHASTVAQDHLLAHKSGWLNVPGFALRTVIACGAWIWLARKLSGLRPGEGGRNLRVAASFMALFALTFSLASVDWIQSLEPHWFSTIFALHGLAAIGTGGVAACILVLLWMRRTGRGREFVTRDTLEDLAKILMGLSLFWAYVWYCQYMIIWYVDIPEETTYYLARGAGDWRTLVRLDLLVNFVVPFLALMLKSWRRNPVALGRVAALVLAGRALDLFLLIAPPLQGSEARVGAWELGPLLGAAALFLWLFLRGLAREPLLERAPASGARG
jgi:hypothetical protein